MAAVINALKSPKDIDAAYTRAVAADPHNAVVLRQFDTYYGAYDRIGRGEAVKRCPIDRGAIKCDVCKLRKKWPIHGLKPGPRGRSRRLDSICQILLDQEPPPVHWDPPPKKKRGIAAMLSGLWSRLWRK